MFDKNDIASSLKDPAASLRVRRCETTRSTGGFGDAPNNVSTSCPNEYWSGGSTTGHTEKIMLFHFGMKTSCGATSVVVSLQEILQLCGLGVTGKNGTLETASASFAILWRLCFF